MYQTAGKYLYKCDGIKTVGAISLLLVIHPTLPTPY